MNTLSKQNRLEKRMKKTHTNVSKEKKKKKHKKRRHKKDKKNRGETEGESNANNLSNDIPITTRSNDTMCETTTNILPALLHTSCTKKRNESQTINILPAILNHDELKDASTTSDQALASGKDLLKDIMKVINEQESKRKELINKGGNEKNNKHSSQENSTSRVRSKGNTRRTKSRSKHRSRSRSHRKKGRSQSHSHSRSRSRSRHRRHHRRSKSRSQRRSRSKSRSRHRGRSKSRSQRRSRSRSRSRHRRKSRSHSQRHSRSKSPKSSWDLMYVPSSKNYSTYQHHTSSSHRRSRTRSCSRKRSPCDNEASTSSDLKKDNCDDGPVFTNTTVHVKKSIDIKIPDLAVVKNESSIASNTDVRSSMFGKWEKYEPKGNHQKEIQNLTRLCQNISAKENLPDDKMDIIDEKEENDVHHPFKVAPAPMFLPHNYFHKHVPTNPAQAIMAGTMKAITGADPPLTGPLEKHFPVSSGNDHRKKEQTKTDDDKHLPVFETTTTKTEERIDVSAVIARRLGAQQILTKNPDDYSAKLVLAECDIKLKRWSDQSKKPGKFTGEIGTRMNKNDIAGAIETWVRKDFFHNLSPVTGGIGQRMMEKMGWQQGTPLGRNQEGFIAPLSLDVKVGRGGLQSVEEEALRRGPAGKALPKKRMVLAPVTNVNGKHPVSALAEICTKQRLGIPTYDLVFEHGQAHNKNFLMKVTVQDVDYQSSVASPNKKHAKAQAAITALRILGVLKE